MRYSLSEADRTLLALGDEATLVHYRLNALLDLLHGGDDSVASRRGVLRNLAANGPLTVPQIASLRPVSRQFVQRVVNALEADGLVERRTNPAHRRSPLVMLTAAGGAVLEGYSAREVPLLDAARRAVRSDEEVAVAVSVLRDVRQHLDALLDALSGRHPEHFEGDPSDDPSP